MNADLPSNKGSVTKRYGILAHVLVADETQRKLTESCSVLGWRLGLATFVGTDQQENHSPLNPIRIDDNFDDNRGEQPQTSAIG